VNDILEKTFSSSGGFKILAPFDRPGEATALGAAGATELYGGVQPEGWHNIRLSATQRTFAAAHFPSESAFAEAVVEARTAGLPVHLTLNAPLYDPTFCRRLVALAEQAVAWGVAGVIVGDLGLLVRLYAGQLPLAVTLSVLAGAWNQQSVAFFRRFGVQRVVLPRHLHLDELGAIVAAHPGLEFEAFVLVGKCPNAEALCTFQHTASDGRWPCEIPYRLHTAGAPLAADHPVARYQRRWQGCDRRLACGLCAVPELARLGVRTLKVVGRGGPTAAKVANVELVARFARGEDPRGARAAYRARFGRACDPLICYYPDAALGEPLR